MYLSRALAIVGVLELLLGCQTLAPREAYVDDIALFSKSAEEMTKVANQNLETLRLEHRLRSFRYALTQHIVAGADPVLLLGENFQQISPTAKKEEIVPKTPEELWVCVPNGTYARSVGERDYVGTYSATIRKLSGDPSDDFAELIKTLRSQYKTTVSGPADGREVLEACVKDMRGYLETAYPNESQKEAGILAVLAAGKSLYDVFNDIFKPLAKQALKEVDSARRAAALKEFLNNPGNRKNLSNAIDHLGRLISEHESRQRHLKIKTVVDATNDFRFAYNNPGKSTSRDRVKECASAMPEDFSKNPNQEYRGRPQFQVCAAKLWSNWEPYAKAMLTAAGEYDSVADRLPDQSATKLIGLSAKLEDVASGRITPEIAKLLIDTLVRWANLAENVKKTTTSEENKKRIDDALSNLKKALKSL